MGISEIARVLVFMIVAISFVVSKYQLALRSYNQETIN